VRDEGATNPRSLLEAKRNASTTAGPSASLRDDKKSKGKVRTENNAKADWSKIYVPPIGSARWMDARQNAKCKMQKAKSKKQKAKANAKAKAKCGALRYAQNDKPEN
jgi:hypothetical protein